MQICDILIDREIIIVNKLDKYTTPPPPPFPILSRLEHIRDLSRDCDASCTDIVSKLFEVAKIAVTVDDQLEQLDDSDSGALFVGDHRQGIEYLPLLAKFGDLQKKDVHFVAKPFSMQARIMGYLAAKSSEPTLPVIPRTLSRDRKNIFNRDLFWRLTKRSFLPSESEIREINGSTLEKASCFIQEREVVVIYPAGGVVDACSARWKRGVGEVIKKVDSSNRDSVKIIPFRFDDFSRWRLTRALARACNDRRHSAEIQEIMLRLGECGTIDELFPDVDKLSSMEITSRLHNQFIEKFGETF